MLEANVWCNNFKGACDRAVQINWSLSIILELYLTKTLFYTVEIQERNRLNLVAPWTQGNLWQVLHQIHGAKMGEYFSRIQGMTVKWYPHGEWPRQPLRIHLMFVFDFLYSFTYFCADFGCMCVMIFLRCEFPRPVTFIECAMGP